MARPNNAYASCAKCERAFVPRPRDVRVGRGRFCSHQCFRDSVRTDRSATTKQCFRCKDVKPAEAFDRSERGRFGRASQCKPCAKLSREDRKRVEPDVFLRQQRAYIAKNPDAVLMTRFVSRLRRYGLTVDAYHALAEAQEFQCAICGKEPDASRYAIDGFNVDHDHNTGAVRGLLCHGCNIGIGAMLDSAQSLRAAAIYLERGRNA